MKLLLGFLPFLAFGVASALGYPELGLFAGLIAATVALVRDWMARGRRLKSLDIGTFVLFAGLLAYSVVMHAALDIATVRIVVDGGLLAIILFTVLIGRPFTLDYVDQRATPAPTEEPAVMRAHLIISLVWALAFAVIVMADFAMWLDVLPAKRISLVIIAALFAAYRFTAWFRSSAIRAVAER